VLLAAAYAGAGPRIFRKRDGELAWAARVVLLPYLIGSRISHALHRRSTDPWNEITTSLLFGRILRPHEAERLIDLGVTAVLDLTPECREAPALRSLAYANIQVLDWTVPSAAQLRDSLAFIAQQTKTGKVYVHCALGVSRSAGVVAAYLMESGAAATADEAIGMARKVRPRVVMTPGWLRLLKSLERQPVE
jgi:hypothetical protein